MPSKKNRLMTDQERLEFIEKWFLGSGEPRKPGPAIGLDQWVSTNSAAEEPQVSLEEILRLGRELEAAGLRAGKTRTAFEHLTGMSLEECMEREEPLHWPNCSWRPVPRPANLHDLTPRPWYRRLWEWLRDQLSAGE